MASVARVTEISARSEQSFEDAINVGVARACQSLRNVDSAWIKEQRVTITDNQVTSYQVNMLVTFELDE